MSGTSEVVSDGEGKPEGLTISEAMRRSKETGAAYTRPGACYWIKWSPNWTYRVSSDDLNRGPCLLAVDRGSFL